MSFAGDTKRELAEARPRDKALKLAQAYGLIAFGRGFSPDQVCLHTESEEIARLYQGSLRSFLPRNAIIELKIQSRQGKNLYKENLPREQDRRALLARASAFVGDKPLAERFAEEEAGALLSGAFLSCGNLSDPNKSYHLEFAVREQPLAEELGELLDGVLPGVGHTRRRGMELLYYKECAQIEDLLTLMGASKASLAMIEIEITKQVRNQAMRATNCETANIDKTVKAAAAQVEDIELILNKKGLLTLPEPLREAALTRLENPELSLRELKDAFPTPISRSGVHHRLAALSRIAAKIREEGEAKA